MSRVCIYFPAHQLNYQVFCTHFKNQLMASRGDILINAPLEWEKRERERDITPGIPEKVQQKRQALLHGPAPGTQ